jgi:hypothetical protein
MELYDSDSENNELENNELENNELENNEYDIIDDKFRNLVIDTKRNLYDNIIFSGKNETKESQDNKLLIVYLNELDKLLNLCNIVKNKPNNIAYKELIEQFPEKSRSSIYELCDYIYNKKYNNVSEYILYNDYLIKSLHEYPYVHDESFIDHE